PDATALLEVLESASLCGHRGRIGDEVLGYFRLIMNAPRFRGRSDPSFYYVPPSSSTRSRVSSRSPVAGSVRNRVEGTRFYEAKSYLRGAISTSTRSDRCREHMICPLPRASEMSAFRRAGRRAIGTRGG